MAHEAGPKKACGRGVRNEYATIAALVVVSYFAYQALDLFYYACNQA